MDFKTLSSTILPELKEKMENHKGLAIFARERAKFEGWLKVEVCGLLAKYFENVLPEKEWIDITFEDWAIELKTVNTNIRYKNAKNKHRPITRNVQGVIEDIEKLSKTDYTNKSVLFVVFPIRHANSNWQIHLGKITEKLSEIEHMEFKFQNKIFGTIYFGKIEAHKNGFNND
jgi:hypothetical protein